MPEQDTIAAVATAAGRSGVGVVRVSGPRARSIIQSIIGRELTPRHATLAQFRDARGESVDQGLAIFFPAPRSYTGEDMLELQGHGGPVVLRLLLARCLELGSRAARPGEFTERAFLNDKLDLAQAESVADLIDAATAEAARGAMRSLQGQFSQRVEALIRGVIELRTLVEATLDFPDEEIDFLKQADAFAKLVALKGQLQDVLSASRQGSLLREGIHIVLVGQPNVGKSSLLNRLAGEELAIVTEFPGTTRDAIRQTISLEGVPAHIIDTAGLRASDDPVEKLGMQRTWATIAKADLVVLLLDATRGETPDDVSIMSQVPASLPCLRVMNKTDLLAIEPPRTVPGTLFLSAKTGQGVDALKRALLEAAGWRPSGEGLFMARERHVQALQQAASCLQRAGGLEGSLELFAEELRLAQDALGAVTGEFTPDDLLGEIFGRFCIGK